MSLNFPVPNPAWPNTGFMHTPSSNFAPRVGLAYRVNDKTIIRGGYGMFYARLLGGLIDDLWTTNGIYQIADSLTATNSTQLAAGPVFPNALAAAPTGASVGAATIQFAQANLKTPYSSQGDITLERQLTSDMALTVSGIFSRGVHLMGSQDLNAAATGIVHLHHRQQLQPGDRHRIPHRYTGRRGPARSSARCI